MWAVMLGALLGVLYFGLGWADRGGPKPGVRIAGAFVFCGGYLPRLFVGYPPLVLDLLNAVLVTTSLLVGLGFAFTTRSAFRQFASAGRPDSKLDTAISATHLAFFDFLFHGIGAFEAQLERARGRPSADWIVPALAAVDSFSRLPRGEPAQFQYVLGHLFQDCSRYLAEVQGQARWRLCLLARDPFDENGIIHVLGYAPPLCDRHHRGRLSFKGSLAGYALENPGRPVVKHVGADDLPFEDSQGRGSYKWLVCKAAVGLDGGARDPTPKFVLVLDTDAEILEMPPEIVRMVHHLSVVVNAGILLLELTPKDFYRQASPGGLTPPTTSPGSPPPP